jgi:3-demethoxyubiquinol 3-hydroxylase
MSTRNNLSLIDQLCIGLNDALDALYQEPNTKLKSPADAHKPAKLDEQERKDISGKMRINHVGELCAQALYLGQAKTTSDKKLKQTFQHMAAEEKEHLVWCHQRLISLNSKPSILNPLWYAGALGMGMLAGLCSKQVGLGFIAETEQQVQDHLQDQLQSLPKKDKQTHAIINQMHQDEKKHANWAINQGAQKLPSYICSMMRFSAAIMKKCAYVI